MPTPQVLPPYPGPNKPNYGISRTGFGGGGPSFTGPTGGGGGIGNPPTGYDPRTGGIPQLPSPIKGGLSDLANVYKLAGGVNAFNTQNQLNDLMAKIPNYQQLVNQNSGNIMSGLKGQLPQDVITQMIQNMAQRGIGRGMAPGSANNNAAYIRALGTNSLALQNTAFGQLQQTIAGVPKIQEFDIQRMLDEEQKARAMQSIYNSSPNPFASSEYLRNQVGAGVGNRYGGYAPPPAVPGGQLGGGATRGNTGYDPGPAMVAYSNPYDPFADANKEALKYAGVPRGNTYGGGSYNATGYNNVFNPGYSSSYDSNPGYLNPGYDLPNTNATYGPSYYTDESSADNYVSQPQYQNNTYAPFPGMDFGSDIGGWNFGADFLNP